MKKKIKEWLKRYLIAEIACLITALIASFLAIFLTGNRIIIAYAGTFGENIGFYGTISTRDIIRSIREHKSVSKTYGINSFLKNLRNLLVEFGPSEALDSFVVRPFCLYIFPLLLGSFAVGIVVGKLVADVVFYAFTIIAYELRKKHLKA